MGICKLKPQQASTTHYSDGPNFKKMIPDASGYAYQVRLSYIAGGNAEAYSHNGNQLWQFIIKLNTHLAYDQ